MSDGAMIRYVYVDGHLLPADGRHLSALDRGFTLSDGVFETMRVAGGRAFRLWEHLTRLRASADVLRLPVPWPDEELAEAIARLLAANDLQEAVARLTVSRGVPAERGLLPPSPCAPTLVAQVSPFHRLPDEKLAGGLGVHTSSIRRNETSPTCRIKVCSYLDNVLARMEAREAGADEALLLNTAGFLACCSSANLHVISGGRVLTPSVECGALPGITRGVVQELAAGIGLVWEEAWLRPADLAAAEEALLTNSVLGVVAITRVDGRLVGLGTPGRATLRLAREYEDLLRP